MFEKCVVVVFVMGECECVVWMKKYDCRCECVVWMKEKHDSRCGWDVWMKKEQDSRLDAGQYL